MNVLYPLIMMPATAVAWQTTTYCGRGPDRFDLYCRRLELRRPRFGVGGVDGQEVGHDLIGEVQRHEQQPAVQAGICAGPQLHRAAPRRDAPPHAILDAERGGVLGIDL